MAGEGNDYSYTHLEAIVVNEILTGIGINPKEGYSQTDEILRRFNTLLEGVKNKYRLKPRPTYNLGNFVCNVLSETKKYSAMPSLIEKMRRSLQKYTPLVIK